MGLDKQIQTHKSSPFVRMAGKSGGIPIQFKVCGYTSMFSANFRKGDNFYDFLFAYLEDEVFPDGVYSEREEFAPMGANSFLYELTPIYMGGNNENDKSCFP